MSTIDKAALIEQAARASFMRPGMPLAHWERCNEDSREAFSEDAARSLPVIAKALLAPLRVEIERLYGNAYIPSWVHGDLSRLLDAIEAEVQP